MQDKHFLSLNKGGKVPKETVVVRRWGELQDNLVLIYQMGW